MSEAPPKRLHEILDGTVLADEFERYAASAERSARELEADAIDNDDPLLPRLRAEAQALRLAAAVAGGRLRFCNICGGVVDLTGADRPSARVGVGAPLKNGDA